MTPENHSIEKEQVMAYLDGELSSGEAKNVAAHLEQCADCRQVAADLRETSARMLDWSVELSAAKLTTSVRGVIKTAGNPSHEKNKISRVFFTAAWRKALSNRWLLAAAIGAACVAIGVSLSGEFAFHRAAVRDVPPHLEGGNYATRKLGLAEEQALTSQQMEAKSARREIVAGGGGDASDMNESMNLNAIVPLIARNASLSISVRNFATGRASVDHIVQAHNGYVGALKITSPKDGPQLLETTLRIPAAQFDAALVDLKALGHVEQEQQGGEEVTAQVVDLEARLKNSRETEARMAEVLRTRTGKINDVLEVEKEMARVREEIEQMEAEQKGLNTRIAFASIDLNMSEEYQAPLGGGRSSLWLQFRNALVDGYRSAADSFASVLVFFLSVGPTIIVWGAILFFPARWAWLRWRKTRANLVAGT